MTAELETELFAPMASYTPYPDIREYNNIVAHRTVSLYDNHAH